MLNREAGRVGLMLRRFGAKVRERNDVGSGVTEALPLSVLRGRGRGGRGKGRRKTVMGKDRVTGRENKGKLEGNGKGDVKGEGRYSLFRGRSPLGEWHFWNSPECCATTSTTVTSDLI